jgi:hypothetical protein
MTENTSIHLSGSSYKRMENIIHIVAWVIVFGIPFFFTGREQQEMTTTEYIHREIAPISFMLVFYINYFLLVDYFLFSKHTWRFILCNVVLIAIVMGVVHIFMQMLPPPMGIHPHHRDWNEILGFFLVNALLYMLVAGLSVAIRMTANWYQLESSKRELEKSKAEAELQNLKSQLNPHFLFNTLNNIYSLIAFSPEKAQKAVHDLSRLLRYVLYDSNQPEVPLEKELDFIRNYVELMRIRLPQHVELETNIAEANPGSSIAPLLFISLIENAFKHGVSNSKPSFIHIDIHQDHGRIVCDISNSYFPKDNNQDKSGSGIGLQNLRRRLELLYPSRHIFTYGQDGEKYNSLLEILA